MGRIARTPRARPRPAHLLVAQVLLALAAAPACTLFSASTPCADDVDCPRGRLCASDGFCAAGPDPSDDGALDGGVDRRDAGLLDDAGEPVPEDDAGGPPPDAGRLDAGGDEDDGGAPADDGGAAFDDGGAPAGDGGAPAEDGGAPDAGAPDAGEPDAGFPDAGFPDAGPPPCADVFGGVTGFVLCAETPVACELNANTGAYAPNTCRTVCESVGKACLGALDNAAEPCGPTGTVDTCDTPRNTEICTCAR